MSRGGCPHCKRGPNTLRLDAGGDVALEVVLVSDGERSHISVACEIGRRVVGAGVPVYHCPMCGRQLRERKVMR